jgi:hypothetical protein
MKENSFFGKICITSSLDPKNGISSLEIINLVFGQVTSRFKKQNVTISSGMNVLLLCSTTILRTLHIKVLTASKVA